MSRRQYQAWTTLAESASLTRPRSCWARWRPGRPPWPSSCRHRPGPPDRPPARRRARAPPPGRRVTSRAGSSSGPRLGELAAAAGEDRLLAAAGPVLTALRDMTGESAQLYRRQGDERICVAAAERLSGLRDTVPVGSSAADDRRVGRPGPAGLGGAGPLHRGLPARAVHRHRAVRRTPPWLGAERRRARGRGRVGVRAGARPVRPGRRRRRVSGPIERLTRTPAGCTRRRSSAAANALTEALRRNA